MKINRKDKNIKPRYQQLEEAEEKAREKAFGKGMLLLVEGETEEAYFEKLKQNPWLNGSLAGVTVAINNDFETAVAKANELAKQGTQVWKIVDNDKQNAFVLEQGGTPFFSQAESPIPSEICKQLQKSYDPDKHNYFLSVHDYLQWLNQAIGAENTVEYWDRIQYCTPIKNWEFEKYFRPDRVYNDNLKLAYSCISFEFWLLLHFEKNSTSFLWVDKGKPKTVDVVEYFKTIQSAYEKGYFNTDGSEKSCHAYNCLLPDFKKKSPPKEDEWQVLVRIFKAINYAEWLRGQMKPFLERQSGKWYEVNPYMKGMDDLLKELLNIKPLGVELDYFGLSIQFAFDASNSLLTFIAKVNGAQSFVVNDNHASCFLIKNGAGQTFLPSIPKSHPFSAVAGSIQLKYDFSQSTDSQLVLMFKDPRSKSKSSQCFFLLSD